MSCNKYSSVCHTITIIGCAWGHLNEPVGLAAKYFELSTLEELKGHFSVVFAQGGAVKLCVMGLIVRTFSVPSYTHPPSIGGSVGW